MTGELSISVFSSARGVGFCWHLYAAGEFVEAGCAERERDAVSDAACALQRQAGVPA